LNKSGHVINSIFICGGLSKNSLFIEEHARITKCKIVQSLQMESVLVGAAVLGACASGDFPSLFDAMKAMNRAGRVIEPCADAEICSYHDKKYDVFRLMYEHQEEYRKIMSTFSL